MTPLHLLYQASAAAAVVIDVIMLIFLVSAYRSVRHKGLMLLIFAYAIWIFDTVFMHMVSYRGMSHNEMFLFECIRKGIVLGGVILFASGVVLIVKSLSRISMAGKKDACRDVTENA